MTAYTPAQKERLIVWLMYPSRVAKACDWLVLRLYRYSDKVAGYPSDDVIGDYDAYRTKDGWPLRARLISLIGDRVDDVGSRANGRKADRRLRARGRA